VRFTYAALRERVARLGGGLDAEGLAAGDRLAAVVPPRHESVQLYWACQWVGATLSGVRREAAAALRREVSVDFALGRSS
jgi:acyl-coenzyme A synthetase/AMP-(fatty) acid ligase